MVSALNEDRLFPADPEQRLIARRLYEAIKDRPIISPHGHVPIDWFAEDKHFKNPTDLFITPDHYVTRIMHGHSVPFSELGVGQKNFTEEQSRNAFRLLGKYWYAYAGTPMRYWMEDSLSNVFGINKPLNEDTPPMTWSCTIRCAPTPISRRVLHRVSVRIATLRSIVWIGLSSATSWVNRLA